ncbi:MAG: hypothetical protein ACP5E2_08500, partial [Terracidiphilus sp.]
CPTLSALFAERMGEHDANHKGRINKKLLHPIDDNIATEVGAAKIDAQSPEPFVPRPSHWRVTLKQTQSR